jgi:hypothetical protein
MSHSLRDVTAVTFCAGLLLALWGVVIAWRVSRRDTVLLVLMILRYALGFAVFVGRLRYRIVVLPLLFIFGGAALARLLLAVRRSAAPGALIDRERT